MKKSLPVTLLALCTITTLATSDVTAGTNPNGKPFIQLQDQIIEVEGSVSTLAERVDLLVTRVDSMEEMIAANDTAIATLQNENAELQSQINMLGTDVTALELSISDLESQNSDLEQQIADNSGDIELLQQQVQENEDLITAFLLEIEGLATLQDQIDDNYDMITLIQLRNDQISEDLEQKQNIITQTCPTDWAIGAIYEDGTLRCEEISSSGSGTVGTITIRRTSAQINVVNGSGMNNIIAYCPTGTIIAGGGYFGVDGETHVMDSRPDHINNAWYVVAYRGTDAFFPSDTMGSVATCIETQ